MAENNAPKKEIVLSKTRHLGPKIIAFVLVALGGATMLTLSLLGVLNDGSGYTHIEIKTDKELIYSDGMDLYLYLEGNSFATSQAASRVSETYSQYLKEAHILLSSDEHIAGNKCITLLNEELNKDVDVGEDLYAILKEAYEYSLVNDNYSLFAEPLYDYWESLINNYNVGDTTLDPLVNEEIDDYLKELSSFINDDTHHSLEFKDNNIVKVNISSEYLAFINENELKNVVSLSSLKEAYEMKLVHDRLEKDGITKGYLTNKNGMGLTFSETSLIPHPVLVEDKIIDNIGTLTYSKGSHSFLYYNRFVNNDNAYAIEKDNVTYKRSAYLSLKDYSDTNYFSTLTIIGENKDIVETALIGEKFNAIKNVSEQETLLNNIDVSYLFNKNGDKNIYISKDIEASVTLAQTTDYVLNVIE